MGMFLVETFWSNRAIPSEWDWPLAPAASDQYTEHMLSCRAAPNPRLGSRRLGGPIPFSALWPALREDLHEAYLVNGERPRLDAVRGTAPLSFTTAVCSSHA
jgi:hypothetical protein